MAERMQFTADQKKAIETRGQNILVAAAAGSGKTRVLVERIISQVRAGTLSHSTPRSMPLSKQAVHSKRLPRLSVSAFS